MNGLRPNEQRGKTAIALIWAIFGIAGFAVLFRSIDLCVYYIYMNGGETPDTLINIYDFGIKSASYLTIVAYIISIITFIRWFRRAYYNMSTIQAMEYGDGWAAGAWFVPIMNLFVPYKMMKELYEDTDRYLLFENSESYTKSLNISHVELWWTLWIISRILGNIIGRIIELIASSNIVLSVVIAIINLIILMALCIVTVNVIHRYAEAEKILYNMQQEGSETEKEESLSY